MTKIIYYSLKSHKILNTKFKNKKVISNSPDFISSNKAWIFYKTVEKKIFHLNTSLQAAEDKKESSYPLITPE